MEVDAKDDGVGNSIVVGAEVEVNPTSAYDCAVCLQPCNQPVKLPCGHVFCYLCVKGATQQSKRCAMCRQEIPVNFLDNPQLVAEAALSTVAFEDKYQWFYEGRNGWWQYDDRTSLEIEAAYKKGDTECEVLIAGFLYIIDFQRNLQTRRCDPHRKRHIKRDLVTIPKKGIAGIRQPADAVVTTTTTTSSDSCSSSSDGSVQLNALNDSDSVDDSS